MKVYLTVEDDNGKKYGLIGDVVLDEDGFMDQCSKMARALTRLLLKKDLIKENLLYKTEEIN